MTNLKNMFHRWFYKLSRKLDELSKPNDSILIVNLVMRCAGIELLKDEAAYLNPVKGMYGPVKITGTSSPVFNYRLFEKELMEFVSVRVELSSPDRIEFLCSIDSTTAPERHGESLEVKDDYRDPFYKLAYHLYRYWPICRNAGGNWTIFSEEK